jgi:hypothetical protein
VYFVHYTINIKINQCFFGMFVGFICKLNLNNRIIHIDIYCGKKFQSANAEISKCQFGTFDGTWGAVSKV